VIVVRVDRWLCTGCGLCVGPVFTLEGGYSAVRPEFRVDGDLERGLVPMSLLENVKRAVKACPNRGITYTIREESQG